ncbi:ATP-dependent DNA helicase MER3 [Halocaridina rubra]|uniref:ATP-dependent DNA helicase MER3 n=1 Tax=Halocaridina rubra TaxID=373956 RepID=A0AAN9AHJ5_HALRR
MCGVAYHHAGLESADRRKVEELFIAGELQVLVATSTLAMGVNLPAHLVVIKSTSQYVNGSYEEYSSAQLLQMTGRAGRPQFDDSGVAVIMTKHQHRVPKSFLSKRTNIREASKKVSI